MNNRKELIELLGEYYDEDTFEITNVFFDEYDLLNEKERKEIELALLLIISPENYFKNKKSVVISEQDVVLGFYSLFYHSLKALNKSNILRDDVNLFELKSINLDSVNFIESELTNKEIYLQEKFFKFFQKILTNALASKYEQDKSIADVANKLLDISMKAYSLSDFTQNPFEENDNVKKGKIFIELSNINFNSRHYKTFIEKLKHNYFKSSKENEIKSIFKPRFANDIKKVKFHGSKAQLKSFLLMFKEFSIYDINKDLFEVAILLINEDNDEVLKTEQLIYAHKEKDLKFNKKLKENFDYLRNAIIK